MGFRAQYEEQARENARKAFEAHELRERRSRRWLIQRRRSDGTWDGVFAVEVVALSNRTLYVGGDISAVIFGYGPRDPIRRLYWIGQSTSSSYLREKASIGLTDGGRLMSRWVPECAYEDLKSLVHEEESEDTRDALAMVLEAPLDSQRAMWTALPSGDWPPDLGVVVDTRVFYAHAAVSKLCELLEAVL